MNSYAMDLPLVGTRIDEHLPLSLHIARHRVGSSPLFDATVLFEERGLSRDESCSEVCQTHGKPLEAHKSIAANIEWLGQVKSN